MLTTQYALPKDAVFLQTPTAIPTHRGCNPSRIRLENPEEEIRKRLRWSKRIGRVNPAEIIAVRVGLASALERVRSNDFYAQSQILEACKAFDAVFHK